MKEDKKDQIFIEENKPYEQLSRKLRTFIYMIFLSLIMLINSDTHMLKSCKSQIKRDLQLDEKGYRILGSLFSAGGIFGCIVFIFLLQSDRKKLLTLVCIFINGASFFSYCLTFNRRILYGIRFLNGCFRYYIYIYIPVWVDQFGIKKLKAMMLTLIFPLGQTLGLFFGYINKSDKWYLNYMVLGSLILGFGCLLLLFPSKYFSSKYNFIGYQKVGEEGFVKESSGWGKTSFFDNGEMKIKKGEKGFLLAILKNPVYLLSVFVNVNYLFCFYIIHLNIISYIIEDLKMPEEEKTTKFLPLYGSASVFGPSIGGLFGILCVSFIGYEKKKSAFFLVGFATFALLGSFLVIYSDSASFLCIGLFLFFFFTSAKGPIILVYIISCIPSKYKGAGYSLNLLITTLLGRFPGPILYGFLKDNFKDTNPRLPWKISIHMFTLGFLASLGSAYYRYHELAKIEEEENKDNEEELKDIETQQ